MGSQVASSAGTALTPAQQFAGMGIGGKMSAIGQGFSGMGSNFMGGINAMGKGNLLMAGAPLLGALSEQQTDTTAPEQESYIRPQAYDPVTQRYTALEPVKSSEFGDQSFADYRRSQGFQEGGVVEQRYQQPVRTVDPAVTEYNQMLMDQARQEYVQQQPMTNVPQLTPSLMAPPRAEVAVTPAAVDDSRQFIYDPNAQQFNKNPNYIDPDAKKKARLSEVDIRTPQSDYDSMLNMQGAAAGGRIKENFAQGGIASLADVPKFQAGGDMADDAFVIPADVVSALGNGSTKAGLERLNEYLGIALPIEGEGDGLSDDIPATIEGEQPARVADGEAYVPPEIVAKLGGGDPERGAAMLYTMMDKIRESAHGKTDQQSEVKPDAVMPV
jgi:hypothetical protein